MGGKAIYLERICSFALLILLFAANIAPVASLAGAQLDDWSEDVRLTFTDERSTTPAIAVEGDNVYVVWAEDGEGRDRFLWYIKSEDKGETWDPPVCLVNNSPIRILNPKIVVFNDNIHIIWIDSNDKKIHYIHSQDNANSWEAEIILPPLVYTLLENWDIGVNENYLHVVYVDINNRPNYFKSNDNGNTWESSVQLVPTIDNVGFAGVAVSGDNVHIVLSRVIPGSSIGEIFYFKSEDNGETWGPVINITESLENYYLDICVDNDDIYIVYRGNSNGQAFLSCSEDNGNSWIRNIKISNSTDSIFRPAIATDGKRVFVVWKDYRDGLGHIYYANSNDGGKNWFTDARLSNTSSWYPDVAVNRNAIHIVWSDERDGNKEIYYKRYLLSATPILPTIDIDPNTLNLRSKGQWITTYIELPDGYDVNDIDVSTILLEDIILAENHPTGVGDYDNDGILDLMIKFDRSEVEDILVPSDGVILTISGNMTDGTPFRGYDIIRTI